MIITQVAGRIRETCRKALVGQEGVVELMTCALLSGGHVLLEGVPGLGKTLAARLMAQAVRMDFKRIQFTPDMLPADILGTNVYDPRDGQFHVKKGPLFTQLLLADEINRTPPKTQSALLEAMEENRVSLDGQTYPLAAPFWVVATQNPVEYEGTYPLPEAQLDRFLMKILVTYPTPQQEAQLLGNVLGGFDARHLEALTPVATAEDVLACRAEISQVRVEPQVGGYLVGLVTATRQAPQVLLGASPRAGIAWMQAARVYAAMHGRDFVIPEDIQALALPVLRHRLVLQPEAEMESVAPDQVIQGVLARTPVPR
ncbi:MAG: AAA family ATPase [Christensenellales bacterium]